MSSIYHCSKCDAFIENDFDDWAEFVYYAETEKGWSIDGKKSLCKDCGD